MHAADTVDLDTFSVTRARQMLAMITDLPTSGRALAAMQVGREKKKITLVTSAGSSEITGKQCSPYAAHWTWDTYAMAHGTGSSVVEQGGKSWFSSWPTTCSASRLRPTRPPWSSRRAAP